ncbi:MAG: hypothetical protein Kow00109_04680 [Acidobacteriota bacterium]
MNWYLFSGYAVFWILIFAYVVFLYREHKALQAKLEQLRAWIEKEPTPPSR